MKKLAGVVTALLMAGMAATSHAAPIQLFGDQITKLKFVNFERLLDANGNVKAVAPGTPISAGDTFEGILNVEAITNVTGSSSLSAQLATSEVTGYFKISVLTSTVTIGGPGHIDFGLTSGDFIRLYVGTGATKDWDPAAANAVTRASNGALWAEILPNGSTGGFAPHPVDGATYEGINDTVVSFPSATSENWNWANLTTNLTGYLFQPTLWPETLGITPSHTYLGDAKNGHVSQLFFQSHLFTTDVTGWQFRSEDPIYLNAVPEPGTMILLGTGLLGLARLGRRRSK